MNIGHSKGSTSESTPIDGRTPLKRLKITLASKLGLHSNPNSPTQTPPAKRSSSNPPSSSKLDSQIYLDTQSNGFASRVVKYHEAGEAKNREIANRTYRRLGDFPIVNLDKNEISLNQKQANEPKVSKINIAPPINLVKASERSSIFRTGKNYGDSYPTGAIGKIGPIEGRKPIRPPPSQDKPIVTLTSDYDSGTARSSLDALKEISRKRIHCDEIDGDAKKQRSENIPNEYDQNSVLVPITSKRTRDRTSPSYCSPSTEVQKKRYKNNDIFSSLSSSILIGPPKRSSLSIDVPPSTNAIQHDYEHTKEVNERQPTETVPVKQKAAESSRVGTSNSDLPLHRPTEPIKPVIKSMSDGYVPKSEASKAPKLTLFNKDYSNIPSASQRKRNVDDDYVDDYTVSFVKPKSKASTIFSQSKSKDQKSKLAMMLDFLRGDESKDMVDSGPGSKTTNAENVEPKTVVSSPSANLSTNTSVTFSTATTTSVLNAPSDASSRNKIELPKEQNTVLPEVSKPVEPTVAPATATITSAPSLPVITVTAALNQSSQAIGTTTTITSSPASIARNVTFNLPSTQTTSATSPSQTTTSSESVPRLGGFSFSATSTTFTSPSIAKPTVTERPILKNPIATNAPTFSFGTSNSTAANTLPSFAPPTFGATTTTAKPETVTTTPQSVPNIQTTANPPKFNFGPTATNPPTFGANTTVSFGSPAVSSTAVAANPSTNAPPMFAFGATANKTAAATTASPSTTIAKPAAFAFGSTAPNTAPTSAPTFGFGTPSTIVTTASSSVVPSMGQTKPAFSFGNTSNAPAATKPDTSAFQFGNAATSVTTSSLTFGTMAANTAAAPSTGLFGATNTTNASSTAPNAFSFTANKPAANTNPTFGAANTQVTSSNTFSAPIFGNLNAAPPPPYGQTNTVAGAATSAPVTTNSTNLFGNASGPAQNTPIFGASNPATAQPKVENTFGMGNQSSGAAPPSYGAPNQTSTFGSSIGAPNFGATANVFGSQSTTQNPPAFGSNTNLFSGAAPTTQANSTFGTPSNVFGFGSNAQSTPATTASTGLFGSTNTNTAANAAFVFGQSNAAAPNQTTGLFSAKPAESVNTNAALTAPPAFGSTSPAFNFNAKPVFGSQSDNKQPAFAFNAPANATASAPAFGSTSTTPHFGSTNGIATPSFSFNASANATDASKSFGFGGPATAPAATPAGFSFNSPAPNAFGQTQMGAPQPTATPNIFSIGPGSGTNTTKTGRPMRTATRRIK